MTRMATWSSNTGRPIGWIAMLQITCMTCNGIMRRKLPMSLWETLTSISSLPIGWLLRPWIAINIITFFSKAITILALRQERPTMDCCKIRPQLLIGYIATNCFVLIRCSINIPSMRYWLMSGTLIPGKSRIRQRLVSLRVSPWQM